MDITELQRLEPGKPVNRHPWEKARARIISFLLSAHQPKSRHIADIGSGDAYVLDQLAKRNHAEKYSAIDTAYTPVILERISPYVDTTRISFYKNITELEKAPVKADAVLFLDVLEHCEDDNAVLGPVSGSGLVTGNGLILITVPAYQSLFSSHDKLLLHYRRYNRQQLIKLVHGEGLEVIESGYFFGILLPVRIVQLILEKMGLRKPTRSLDSWKGNKGLTSLFYTILWAGFRVSHFFTSIGLRLPGLSCYCICRKLPS